MTAVVSSRDYKGTHDFNSATVVGGSERFRSPHDFDPLVGTGNAVIDSNAIADLIANHAGKVWLFRSNTDYRLTGGQFMDLRDLPGQQMVGGDPSTCRLVQTDRSVPIIATGRVSGTADWQKISGFRLDYSAWVDGSMPTESTAIAIQIQGVWNHSVIEHVQIFNCYRGISHDNTAVGGAGVATAQNFSNRYSDIKVQQWGDWAFVVTPPNGSTGNLWQNIMMNNRWAGGTNRTGMPFIGNACSGGMWLADFPESTFMQVNFEYFEPTVAMARLERCQEPTFTGVHIEGVHMPDDTALFVVEGDRGGLNVAGLHISFLSSTGTDRCAIVSVDSPCAVDIAGTVRDTKLQDDGPDGAGLHTFMRPNGSVAGVADGSKLRVSINNEAGGQWQDDNHPTWPVQGSEIHGIFPSYVITRTHMGPYAAGDSMMPLYSPVSGAIAQIGLHMLLPSAETLNYTITNLTTAISVPITVNPGQPGTVVSTVEPFKSIDASQALQLTFDSGSGPPPDDLELVVVIEER